MTFLEYVCERLLGPPAKRVADRLFWLCPFHNDSDPSFCTLPHKQEYKDRWRCFGCGKRGDEADLLKEYYPDEGWASRRARLRQWRQDYEAALTDAATPPAGTASSSVSSFGESGIGAGSVALQHDDATLVEQVYKALSIDDRILLAEACAIAREMGISLDALAWYCFHSIGWDSRGTDHDK